MTNAPERIRVARDADGFWTCREAVSGSQEYIRDDLYYAANNRARASEAEATSLRRKLEKAIEALTRLSSPEAFCSSRMANDEERARMFYAEGALVSIRTLSGASE